VQQHLGRQAGVAKVEVNLLEGKVTILLKEDSRFDPAVVLKATYDSGVTLTEMSIVATGEIERGPGGSLWFRVNAAQGFEVRAGKPAEGLQPLAGSGTPVTLRGRLYRKTGKEKEKAPALKQLEVLEVLKKGQP